MYTKSHRQYIVSGRCSHLLDGGRYECEKHASKCWVYLQETKEVKLDIVLAIPVCPEHVWSMRALLNNSYGYLKSDDWEIIDRNSAYWTLVIDDLDK